jgi:hypothetical protein
LTEPTTTTSACDIAAEGTREESLEDERGGTGRGLEG